MEVPEEHREFARAVKAARMQNPMSTLETLSEETAIPVDDLVHYALVRWAASGAEMLMSTEPLVLRQLLEAREANDWEAVAGILDWLAAGESGRPEGAG